MAVHRALASLPLLSSPAEVRVANGLYFFYEEGETSRHAPRGRVVRIGNHPRSDGTLVRRLSQHLSGGKNGSVLRKAIGGALLRRSDPDHLCLAPQPGAGHWERQGLEPCGRCLPTEEQVTQLMRERFTFRVVEIVDRATRNELEGRLIATLAACPVCGPSPAWLGHQAYSPATRQSGLWNTEFVGDAMLTWDQLEMFETFVRAGGGAAPPLRARDRHPVPAEPVSKAGALDPDRTLVIIPCAAGKRRGSDPRGSGPGIAESLSDALAQRLLEARAGVAGAAGVDQARMAAWRRYGPGRLYEAAGASLERGVERWPHILILSGGYGVVTARELIGNYDRQLQLEDWPPGLLHEVLATYAAAQGIERFVGFAARHGNYRTLLQETVWPDSVRSGMVAVPSHPQGVDPRRATPHVLGAALGALLDGNADLSDWRDPRYGSHLEIEPWGGGGHPSAPAPGVRISPAALAEVRTAFDRYRKEVEAAQIAGATKRTYLDHSRNFVRWLEGRFTPGSRGG